MSGLTELYLVFDNEGEWKAHVTKSINGMLKWVIAYDNHLHAGDNAPSEKHVINQNQNAFKAKRILHEINHEAK